LFAYGKTPVSAASIYQETNSTRKKNMPIWLQIVFGFMALCISLAAAYISWCQSKVAKAKLQADLLDRRLDIYNELVKMIGEVQQKASIEYTVLPRLVHLQNMAELVCSSEISTFIGKFREKAHDLSLACTLLENENAPDRQAQIAMKYESANWITNQWDSGHLARLFRPLIRIQS
jgi:hypothetical protein